MCARRVWQRAHDRRQHWWDHWWHIWVERGRVSVAGLWCTKFEYWFWELNNVPILKSGTETYPGNEVLKWEYWNRRSRIFCDENRHTLTSFFFIVNSSSLFLFWPPQVQGTHDSNWASLDRCGEQCLITSFNVSMLTHIVVDVSVTAIGPSTSSIVDATMGQIQDQNFDNVGMEVEESRRCIRRISEEFLT